MMKHFFSLLLIGVLTMPASGCAPASATETAKPRAAREPTTTSAQDVSERLAALYQISIEVTEQDLASLSGEISALPVQPRPATTQLQDDCLAYAARIDSIQTTVTDYRSQIDAEKEAKNLRADDYDALLFLCDQLDARTDTLRCALHVVYGIDTPAAAA